jgi:hypothetical protein
MPIVPVGFYGSKKPMSLLSYGSSVLAVIPIRYGDSFVAMTLLYSHYTSHF